MIRPIDQVNAMLSFLRFDCLRRCILFACPWFIAAACEVNCAAAGDFAVVRGRVLSNAGEFLPAARIRIWLSSEKEGGLDIHSKPTAETTTDEEGRYNVAAPLDSAKPHRAFVQVTKPGFRSIDYLSTWNLPSLQPGQTLGVSCVLRSALYVAGRVVDEQGAPVAAAEITARLENKPWLIEATVSDQDGRFELLELPLRPPSDGAGREASIRCFHPGLLLTNLTGIYQMPADERSNLRVVMPAGRIVSGRLTNEAGQPVAPAMVEAVYADPELRQAVMGDAQGCFKLTGLMNGPVKLRAHAMDFSHKGDLKLLLDRDQSDVMFRLPAVKLKTQPATYELLGLIVADNSPELVEFYDLPDQQGVVVLGRSERQSPFSSKVQIGDCLEFAGSWSRRTHGLRVLIAQMLGEVDRQRPKPGEKYPCPIFYRTRRLDRWVGEDFDYLTLDQESIEKLRRMLTELRGG